MCCEEMIASDDYGRTGNKAAEADFTVLSRHSSCQTEEIHEQTRNKVSSAEIRNAHLLNIGQESLSLEPNCSIDFMDLTFSGN
jgi:hypothetical protein